MSFWNKILKVAAPVLGAVGGSELGGLADFSGAETLGGALGGALGGGLTSGTTGALLGGAGGALYANTPLEGDINNYINGLFSGGSQATNVAGAAASLPNPAGGVTPTPGGAINLPAGTGQAVGPGIAGSTPDFNPLSMDDEYSRALAAATNGSEPSVRTMLGQGALSGAAAAGAPGLYGGTGVIPVGGGLTANQPGLISRVANSLKGVPGLETAGKLAIPAASLALSAKNSNQAIPFSDEMAASARRQDAQSQSLTAPLTGGALPEGLQSQIDQASQSAKAAIRSQFASRGMSGSSAEQDALRQVDQQAVQQRFQMASELARVGFAEAGAANSLYAQLGQQEMAKDRELSDTIAAMAAAMSRPTIQIGA